MKQKKCPKCGYSGIGIQSDIDGDFPIGRCANCGHCFMDLEDRNRIRKRNDMEPLIYEEQAFSNF